ncbi:GlcNAc-PI de-N-acetylase [Jatrophihabitans sp. GAS493]|nr:PIG-L family deacetylase [Jatrophihabitans sp. GAS493]SOD70272.1 GlcNAc-PI de-N-acetylase [Jatrophihabitans sp. GAS493]
MLELSLVAALRAQPRPVLVALGAHCDDVEIGAGATIAKLSQQVPGLTVVATVLASTPPRAAEAFTALPAFAAGAAVDLQVLELPDGRLPEHWLAVKEAVHATRDRADAAGGSPGSAAVVLAPSAQDAHQDHRLLGEIAPTVFRDQLILSYEILKYDGDLGRPNVYVAVSEEAARRKSQLLHEHFGSQRGSHLVRRRDVPGPDAHPRVECNQRYAEAFTAGKILL